MGKISSLPEDVRQELIGYLAQPGIITSITAEVPKKKCAEFESKYGVMPYPVSSEKKYGDQFRIYFADPDGCPDILKNALDKKYSRLNDTTFIRELVDDYGFSFFQPLQDSGRIKEKAKAKGPKSYASFMKGFNSSRDFLSALSASIDADGPVDPLIQVITSSGKPAGKSGKKAPSHLLTGDSNAGLSEKQLLHLGWTGEQYLYKLLESNSSNIISKFGIDPDSSYSVIWFNNGFNEDPSWKDKSVGKGCDILINNGPDDIFIEVKTSKRKSPIFVMSSFEMQTMQMKKSNYYLVKIDNIERLITGNAPDVRIFSSPFEYFFVPNQMYSAVFYCN